MIRNEIKPGYVIKLDNGSTFTIYMVENTKYVCRQETHHMCLKLEEVCNEDLSPIKGVSPIVKVWDNYGRLMYFREETVTVSMEQIAKMLNIPVERLRIKEQVMFVLKQEKIQHIELMRLFLTFFNFEFSILENNIDWQYSSIGLEYNTTDIEVESSSLSIVTTVFHCVRLVVRENSQPF